MRAFTLFTFLILLLSSQVVYTQPTTSIDTVLLTHTFLGESRNWEHIVKGKQVDHVDQFKGKPSQLDHFAIYEISFQREGVNSPSAPGRDSSRLYVLSGLKKDRKIIIADTDRNGDFSNDKMYEYSVQKAARRVGVDSCRILNIPYQYVYNGTKLDKNINLKILPFEPVRLSAITNQELLDIYFSIHSTKQTILSIKDKRFRISLVNSKDLDAGYERCTIEIKNASTNETLLNDPPVQVGQEVELADQSVLIDRISLFGDSVYVKMYGTRTISGVRIKNKLPDDLANLFLDKISLNKTVINEYILIDFWGSWCGPCIKAIPDLNNIYSEFGGNGKLIMVSVASERRQSDRDKMEKIINENDMKWIHIAEFGDDIDDQSFVKEFGVSFFPTTILLDKNMNILRRDVGTDGVKKLYETLRSIFQ